MSTMSIDVSVVAGSVATAVFAVSTVPMLVKAHRTKDVGSYSLGNIALGNIGNAFYTVYVLHLPAGPIWALHGFHTVSTAVMLFWYLRYVLVPRSRQLRAARATGRRVARQPVVSHPVVAPGVVAHGVAAARDTPNPTVPGLLLAGGQIQPCCQARYAAACRVSTSSFAIAADR